MLQLKVSLLVSLKKKKKKTLTLVDQKRNPNNSARLHFYNTETLTISGYDKTEEALDSSQSSKRTRSFRRLKSKRQKKRKKGRKKKKKKAKMADCTQTPLKKA